MSHRSSEIDDSGSSREYTSGFGIASEKTPIEETMPKSKQRIQNDKSLLTFKELISNLESDKNCYFSGAERKGKDTEEENEHENQEEEESRIEDEEQKEDSEREEGSRKEVQEKENEIPRSFLEIDDSGSSNEYSNGYEIASEETSNIETVPNSVSILDNNALNITLRKENSITETEYFRNFKNISAIKQRVQSDESPIIFNKPISDLKSNDNFHLAGVETEGESRIEDEEKEEDSEMEEESIEGKERSQKEIQEGENGESEEEENEQNLKAGKNLLDVPRHMDCTLPAISEDLSICNSTDFENPKEIVFRLKLNEKEIPDCHKTIHKSLSPLIKVGTICKKREIIPFYMLGKLSRQCKLSNKDISTFLPNDLKTKSSEKMLHSKFNFDFIKVKGNLSLKNSMIYENSYMENEEVRDSTSLEHYKGLISEILNVNQLKEKETQPAGKKIDNLKLDYLCGTQSLQFQNKVVKNIKSIEKNEKLPMSSSSSKRISLRGDSEIKAEILCLNQLGKKKVEEITKTSNLKKRKSLRSESEMTTEIFDLNQLGKNKDKQIAKTSRSSKRKSLRSESEMTTEIFDANQLKRKALEYQLPRKKLKNAQLDSSSDPQSSQIEDRFQEEDSQNYKAKTSAQGISWEIKSCSENYGLKEIEQVRFTEHDFGANTEKLIAIRKIDNIFDKKEFLAPNIIEERMPIENIQKENLNNESIICENEDSFFFLNNLKKEKELDVEMMDDSVIILSSDDDDQEHTSSFKGGFSSVNMNKINALIVENRAHCFLRRTDGKTKTIPTVKSANKYYFRSSFRSHSLDGNI